MFIAKCKIHFIPISQTNKRKAMQKGLILAQNPKKEKIIGKWIIKVMNISSKSKKESINLLIRFLKSMINYRRSNRISRICRKNSNNWKKQWTIQKNIFPKSTKKRLRIEVKKSFCMGSVHLRKKIIAIWINQWWSYNKFQF